MSFGNFTPLDLACLIICGILSLSGYRRGAINSLIRFGGFIASFVIARLFSPPLAARLMTMPLFKSMIDRINVAGISQNLLKSLQGGGLQEEGNDLFTPFYKMAENLFISSPQEGLNAMITLVIAQFISFGLIIILVSILIGILQFIFRGVKRLPVIGGIDRLLGLGIGLIIGLGFCFLMVWVFNIIDLYNDEALNWLNYQNSFFYQKIITLFLNSIK